MSNTRFYSSASSSIEQSENEDYEEMYRKRKKSSAKRANICRQKKIKTVKNILEDSENANQKLIKTDPFLEIKGFHYEQSENDLIHDDLDLNKTSYESDDLNQSIDFLASNFLKEFMLIFYLT